MIKPVMNKGLTKRKARRRFSAEQRRQLLEEFAQRQEAAADFARRHGMATSTVHRWARAQRSERSGSRAPLEFREVHVAGPAAGSWAGEVSLPDGTALRWNGPAGLAGAERLLSQLRRPC